MLMTMAEAAENPVAYQRTLSLAEKWSQEPPFVQVEILDGHAELTPPMKTLQLTDGNAAAAGAAAAGAAAAGDAADEKLGEVETDSDTSDVEEEDIIDAEVEDCPPTAPKSD
jgi:hypothetical protein